MTLTRVSSSVRQAFLLAAVAVGVHTPPLTSQGATGRIDGHVRDSLKVPIVNATVLIIGTTRAAHTDVRGAYSLDSIPPGTYAVRFTRIGYRAFEVAGLRVLAGSVLKDLDVVLKMAPVNLQDVTVTTHTGNPLVPRDVVSTKQTVTGEMVSRLPVDRLSESLTLQPGVVQLRNAGVNGPQGIAVRGGRTDQNATYIDGVPTGGFPGSESYDRIVDNPFFTASVNPLSTFSVDVDRAAYSNIRRFITDGRRPDRNAVRIEEMINYFPYDYPAPSGPRSSPVTITTEVAVAPWSPDHRLVRIGLQATKIELGNLPPSNLVFLLDVSGSMAPENRLPLLKKSLRLLVENLREQDRVALVVYAGAAGLVLPSTSGAERVKIMDAIERLSAGGSTAGGAGLRLAYRIARENLITGGNNRVILATDGDFNVGTSSDADMEQLIEGERQSGVFLTVLGVGFGNLKDSKLERLADKGNGNYAYIDGLLEARKVLVEEMGGTLVTVAKDVKLQVEFNPAKVFGYRLIGYEDRLLSNADFKNDRKDAGDMGAGHSVTALYEVVLTGATDALPVSGIDTLRYLTPARLTTAAGSDELLLVKVRYKDPDGSVSKEMQHVVPFQVKPASSDFAFATAVAEFGMLLRDSEYKGSASTAGVLARARESIGADRFGYRSGFVQLVEAYEKLSPVVGVKQ